jgi:hypothetical protein
MDGAKLWVNQILASNSTESAGGMAFKPTSVSSSITSGLGSDLLVSSLDDTIKNDYSSSNSASDLASDEIARSIDPSLNVTTISTAPFSTSVASNGPETLDLNSILSTTADPLSPHLVLQLQLLSQELSLRIDALCDEALKAIPRILHDLEFISKDATALLGTIRSIHTELEATDRSSPHEAFDNLVKMDTIRKRMEASRAALKEAESWTTLTTEIEAIFASNDLEKVGARLEEASRSLVLLVGTPEYEERRALLISLRNQLEAALGPKLLEAFQAHQEVEALACQRLFEKIHRKDEFVGYFYKARRPVVVDFWTGLELVHGKSETVETLSKFFEHFHTSLKKESEYVLCAQFLDWCDEGVLTILHIWIHSFVQLVPESLSQTSRCHCISHPPHLFCAQAHYTRGPRRNRKKKP